MATNRLGATGPAAKAGVMALRNGRATVAPVPLRKARRLSECFVAIWLMSLVEKNLRFNNTMKQVAKAMFVLGGVGDDAVEFGTVGKAQLAASGEGEQFTGKCSSEAVVVLSKVITVSSEILIACAIEKLARTIHFRPKAVYHLAAAYDGVHFIAAFTAEAIAAHAGNVETFQGEPEWIDVVMAGGATGNIAVFVQ